MKDDDSVERYYAYRGIPGPRTLLKSCSALRLKKEVEAIEARAAWINGGRERWKEEQARVKLLCATLSEAEKEKLLRDLEPKKKYLASSELLVIREFKKKWEKLNEA